MKIKVSLPKTAKAGSTVKARKFKADIVLPAELVDTLRFFGISSLSGDAEDVGYTVGKTRSRSRTARSPPRRCRRRAR